jgi:hypothetical protein
LEKKRNGIDYYERTIQYRWREYPVTGASFAWNNKVNEIRIKGSDYIAPHELSKEEWKYKDETDFAFQNIKKEWRFLTPNFTINHYSMRELSSGIPAYHLNFDKNSINITYPIIQSDIEDNEFINNYLSSTFGPYVEFIKDWLGAYTFTNYNSLPVLVFAGDRGSGKNTYTQMVCEIYPML